MANTPSEFAAGWRVLLASFIGIAIGVSSLYFYSLGIFIKPMSAEFGWSRADASLGALVGTGCAAIMSIPAGWLVDRFGSRAAALVSLVLLAASFVALGLMTDGLYTFLVLTAGLSLLTAGSSPLPFTRLVVTAFVRNRGIALGIVLAGTGMGAILIPRFLTPFVAENGWRLGFLLLAGVCAALTPIVGLLLIGARDPRTSSVAQDRSAAGRSSPVFVTLAVMFFLTSVAVLGTVVHFVPMLMDAGVSPANAGATASLIGVAAICGRLVTGALLDRLTAKWVAAAIFLVAGAGLLALGLGGPRLNTLGAIVAGVAIGSEVDLIAFLVGRYFPPNAFGRTYGAIYATFLVGGALGPFAAGQIYDRLNGYSVWLVIASALLGCAACVATWLPRGAPPDFAGPRGQALESPPRGTAGNVIL
ncbi:MAG: major facilitator superfamily protein [Alphaproteobacteria bacterium]|nr:MAG: major facilitator superfamily protein [Caulobacteraceae bacterium]TPW05478.1 MAG: major facilitator superfamily protein [Alphaproteobacteria bacterium]